MPIIGFILLIVAVGFLIVAMAGGLALFSVVAAGLAGLGLFALEDISWEWARWSWMDITAWILIAVAVLGLLFLLFGAVRWARWLPFVVVAGLVIFATANSTIDRLEDDEKEVVSQGDDPGTKNPCADLQDAPACAKSRVKSGQAASVPKRVASANVDVALDTASAARKVARQRGYEVDNTTCSKACVLVGGLLDKDSNNPDEVFITLFAKGTVSPVAVKDFANTVLSGADAEIDDRPAEDPKAFADRINVLAQFFDGAHVTIELQKAGTSVVNTVVHNGKVVQFRYTVRKDRYFIRIVKNDVVLEVFVTCGNRKSAQLIPGAPTTKEEPPHDDKPPETSPTTTTTIRTTTTTLKLKDPSLSTNNNPQIPDQVRKDEPSPDNDDEIQEGPIQPVDSPTGCNGPCPAPSTPTTTVPSSSSPPTTIVPSEDRDDYNDGVVLTE